MKPFSFLVGVGLVLSAASFGMQLHSELNAQGNKIAIHVQFDPPHFEALASGEEAVHIDGLFNTLEGGLPSVPVKQIRIALPNGTRLVGQELQSGDVQMLNHQIRINRPQLPISWRSSSVRMTPAAAPVAGMVYPEIWSKVEIQKVHGVQIACITLYPVQVVTGEKQLAYTSQFAINLILAPSTETDRKATASLFEHQYQEVQQLVDNPEVLQTIPHSRPRTRANYDYLILTTNKVIAFQGENSLADFQKNLESRGLSSKVMDVANLTAEGEDQIEKMRNTIKNEYDENGIRYVLLLGRSSTSSTETYLPARKMWTKIKAYFGNGWVDLEEFIPADLYYANLDGTFNGNGNEKWGEPDDGEKGGDVDFLPEVNVGRVSVNTNEELQHFVQKTIWASAQVHEKNVLMLGESLFPELGLYGDEYMDQLVGTSTDHAFSTTGYSDAWTVEKLYDKPKAWSGSQAQSKINTGKFSMVNHLGHSNTTYNMKLSSSSVAKFTNANPYFYYTQGCFAGDFVQGSWIDKLVNTTHGAFAAIANSSYGLAPEDPTPSTTKTPGGSQMLHRQFIHAIFSKGVTVMARAHQMSKEAFLDLKSAQEIRWVNWVSTFFGDPSLEFKVN